MHEVHLMAQLVKMIEASLEENPGASPLRVRLRVSAVSHLMQHDRKTLQAAFELASQGTRAAGAQLDIQQIPVAGFCHGCGRTTDVTELVAACPSCGLAMEIEDVPELELHELVVAE